jgi:hypothetical protein
MQQESFFCFGSQPAEPSPAMPQITEYGVMGNLAGSFWGETSGRRFSN